jgi:peptide subunit release factor 1 (eRF1)
MLTEFKNHLSDRAWERVVSIERLDIRLPQDEAIARAVEAVQEAERSEAHDIASLARDNALAGGLGTYGEKSVLHALDQGAVDTLLMAPTFATTEERNALATLALTTGASIEFVEENEDLKRMGGVAALLRWIPDTLPSLPALREEVEMRPTTPEEALARS